MLVNISSNDQPIDLGPADGPTAPSFSDQGRINVGSSRAGFWMRDAAARRKRAWKEKYVGDNGDRRRRRRQRAASNRRAAPGAGGGDEGLRRTMKSGDGGSGGNGRCTASRIERTAEGSKERERGPNDEKKTDQQKQDTHRNTWGERVRHES